MNGARGWPLCGGSGVSPRFIFCEIGIKGSWRDGCATNETRPIRVSHSLHPGSIVFDCGWCIGEWMTVIYERYQPSVNVFEPVKQFPSRDCEAIRGSSQDPRAFPFGLWKQ